MNRETCAKVRLAYAHPIDSNDRNGIDMTTHENYLSNIRIQVPNIYKETGQFDIVTEIMAEHAFDLVVFIIVLDYSLRPLTGNENRTTRKVQQSA